MKYLLALVIIISGFMSTQDLRAEGLFDGFFTDSVDCTQIIQNVTDPEAIKNAGVIAGAVSHSSSD